MKKKTKELLDSILGRTSKTRYKRIIGLLAIIGFIIIVVTNVSYTNKRGFSLKPWTIEVKK